MPDFKMTNLIGNRGNYWCIAFNNNQGGINKDLQR